MKKTFLISAILILLSLFAYADGDTDNNFYTKLLGGVLFLQTKSSGEINYKFSDGYIISGALGYQCWNGLHVEAEYAFRRNSMRKIHYFGQSFKIPGSFQSSSYMTNLLWDFSICESFLGSAQPFLGGGVGYDVQQFHAHEDGFKIAQNKKGFAWQLMAGLSYPLFCNAEVTLEYRFHKGPLYNFFSHALGVSFIYKLDWQCCKDNI